MSRDVEYMRIDALVPALRNPKRHDIDNLRASLKRFGYTIPALMDEHTGRIVAGHGRLQLLQAIMAEPDAAPPEGIQTDTDLMWMAPVTRGWSSQDDVEAEAYLIADNRQTELGGWDKPELAAALTPIAEAPQGLVGTGYTPRDLKGLLEPERATTGDENSYDERADNYRNKQVRSIMFDYPLADYEFVTTTAAQARKDFGAETNADLFVAMLRKFEEDYAQ